MTHDMLTFRWKAYALISQIDLPSRASEDPEKQSSHCTPLLAPNCRQLLEIASWNASPTDRIDNLINKSA